MRSIEGKFSALVEGLVAANYNNQPFSFTRLAESAFDMVVNHMREMFQYDQDVVTTDQLPRDGSDDGDGNVNRNSMRVESPRIIAYIRPFLRIFLFIIILFLLLILVVYLLNNFKKYVFIAFLSIFFCSYLESLNNTTVCPLLFHAVV